MTPLRAIMLGGLMTGVAMLRAAAAEAGVPEPRLVVVISIDQFRGDYLDRYDAYFGGGGFRRLRAQGTEFVDCQYDHAYTKTAPGHALILSGVHADVHGIIDNQWIDRATGKRLASVEDPDSPLVVSSAAASTAVPSILQTGRSPKNFRATTVGDQLKLRFGDQMRVISVSNKDRAAILLGGKAADGVYWTEGPLFVSSRYYHSQLPTWVDAFNQQKRVDRVFGSRWDLLLERRAYEAMGPDDNPGEDNAYGLGTTFPKTVTGGKGEIGTAFYDAYELTPWATELLAQFAKEAVAAEDLGRHPRTDVLCVGFSQIDYTGHAFGPDSWEVMDSVIRLDRVLEDFFKFLDQRVGADRYLVVLTADHGVAPLPERVAARLPQVPVGRVDWKSIHAAVQDALNTRFGVTSNRWFVPDGSGYHLVPETLQEFRVPREQAEQVVKDFLLTRPEIQAVYTRTELLSRARFDAIGEAIRLGFNAERSPDVLISLRPYFVDRSVAGTNHGTFNRYDTHVPLLWMGPGIPARRETRRVYVSDIAPTLAALLGVTRPAGAMGEVLITRP